MLLSLFVGSAVAAEPKRVDQLIQAQLGEVWGFYFGGFFPYERVDAWMHRPATIDALGNTIWPFADPPVVGTWWWTGDGSTIRRQSWPTYQYADGAGYYFAMFMLPRDEVWFPCSYPFKWKCNYIINPITTEWHSPATQPFETGLYWPWLDIDAAADPQDTVSPVQVWLCNMGSQCDDTIPPYAWAPVWTIDFEVTGYFWKWSDFE
jgi:hypothetical protein